MLTPAVKSTVKHGIRAGTWLAIDSWRRTMTPEEIVVYKQVCESRDEWRAKAAELESIRAALLRSLRSVKRINTALKRRLQ